MAEVSDTFFLEELHEGSFSMVSILFIWRNCDFTSLWQVEELVQKPVTLEQFPLDPELLDQNLNQTVSGTCASMKAGMRAASPAWHIKFSSTGFACFPLQFSWAQFSVLALPENNVMLSELHCFI